MKCGLLGEKLKHSYSPQIHSYLSNYSYCCFEKSVEQLSDFLLHGDFSGLNVTIPYKKAVIPYCSELSDVAKKLGAVNTIVRREDGSLIGHNTDYYGFKYMVKKSGLDVQGKKVLALGSGGASATVIAAMRELGAHVVIVSRSGENNYGNLENNADASVIVNATPVGMYPNAGVSPVDLSIFPNLEGVLDLIYNPARTRLLLDAESRGLVAVNGLWMLVAQAKESAEWFSGTPLDDLLIEKIHKTICDQMQNTVLIGMPGCGKSTIGQLLAEKTGKRFIDADLEIELQAKMSIPEIFANFGEEGFRKLETNVLAELGKESGLVIATGGGCVTRAENYALLHQNGTLVWLKRDISALPTDGRPLSLSGDLSQMYQKRKALYDAFSDYIVCNDGHADDAVNAIMEVLK